TTTLPASQALAMATLHGAKAFGLDKQIGSLEPDKAADLIAIDLSSFITQPVYNPMSPLVYALNSQQVSDVWVAGQRLLKNGQFTHLNPSAILQKVQSWTQQARQFMKVA
ncbi:MAG: amidohydrolase family protein, partial [Proteobacteria bacterium]|nr:amidohydrolase family protein [Pseudomonadota bacterium]